LESWRIKQDENERHRNKFANEFQIGITSKSVAINARIIMTKYALLLSCLLAVMRKCIKRGCNGNRGKYVGEALNKLLCLI